MAGITIDEALDDPALFAPLFQGAGWSRWRVFLECSLRPAIARRCAGLVPSSHRAHGPADASIPRGSADRWPPRRQELCAGPDCGFPAAFRDYSVHLAPGEQAAVAIIAADRKQAKVLLRYCVGLLRAVHMLAGR